MATQAAILAALRLEIYFGIGFADEDGNVVPGNLYENYIKLDDISDWASLLNPGETIKTLYFIQTQVGTTVYKSAGYDADDFSNPEYPTNNPLAQKELPEDAGGNPVEGTYKITVKIQFDDGVTPVIYEKVVYSLPLCNDDMPTGGLEMTYVCKSATPSLTSDDVTNYGSSKYNIQTLVRSHTVYPPDVSGQSSVTLNAKTVTVYNLWSGVTYEAELNSTVTYKSGDNYFLFYVQVIAEKRVVCNDALCVLYCLLKKIRDEYYAVKGRNPTQERLLYERLTLGELEYFMAIQARQCGGDETKHIEKFYVVTALDPHCDCGCSGSSDGNSGAAPVTPTGGGGGGAQGPAGPQGPAGATGATGPAGSDAANNYELALLVNPDPAAGFLPKSTTANAKLGEEVLFNKTENLVSGGLIQCNLDGAKAKLIAVFTFTTNKNTTGKYVYLYVDSQQVGWFMDSTVGNPTPTVTIEIEFYRLTANTAGRRVTIYRSDNVAPLHYYQAMSFIWANNKVIQARAYISDASAADNEIQLVQINLEKYKPLI